MIVNTLNKPGVYQIINLASGKVYIGSSARSTRARLEVHVSMLKKCLHHNSHLQSAWNKYGEDSFISGELIYCEPEEVIRYEQFFMDRGQVVINGYNMCPMAQSSLGIIHTIETRKRISQAHRGKKILKKLEEK